jgi:NADPH:quinone reductase-like Zn-dependent oxidoreductase
MSRCVVVERFGGPAGLRVIDAAEPHAAAGQVRVRVTAAGLNPVDLRIAEGGAAAARFGVTPPFVNGNDFAGVVDEIGEGIEGWAIGDRVYGGARCAAQTEHLLVTDPMTLNPTPAALDDVTASVLDIAGRTALAGIDALDLDQTDTVLIGAAAGGVGVFACQLARRTGAAVLGTAGPRNHEFLRSLGVVPIAYGDGMADRIAAAAPTGVTTLFDAHGSETIELGLALGIPPARINSVADRAAAEAIGALSVGRASTPTSAVREVADAVADGSLLVHIDEVFPLERATEAYERLAGGHVRGKLALRLGG